MFSTFSRLPLVVFLLFLWKIFVLILFFLIIYKSSKKTVAERSSFSLPVSTENRVFFGGWGLGERANTAFSTPSLCSLFIIILISLKSILFS